MNKVKNHPLNNLSLKVISIVIGYTLWAILSNNHTTSIDLNIPLAFYNNKQKAVEAPEQVQVTVHARRSEFHKISRTIALHIDTEELSEGINIVNIEDKLLLLPDTIKLVHSIPDTFSVKVTHLT
jgi:hypothetical protein